MPALLSRASSSILLHGLVMGIWATFAIARRRDPRFRKALEDFRATYLFRSGASARQLVIDGGRVKTRAGSCAEPDCEVIFFDLPRTLMHIKDHPDDRFARLSDNTIEQIGNKFYLLKLGYLGGLCERSMGGVFKRLRALAKR